MNPICTMRFATAAASKFLANGATTDDVEDRVGVDASSRIKAS